MARVPIVTPGAGEQLQPYGNEHLQAADLGAGGRIVGAALGQASEAVQAMADTQEQMDKALDLAAVKRTDAEDAKWLRDQLWTGDNAFYKQQGFNAANARKPLEDAWTSRRDANREALTTDRQRAWYDRQSEQRFGAEQEGMARHVQTEVVAEQKRQSLALMTEHSNDAVTYWDNPERRQMATEAMLSELRSQAASGGWAPEVEARAEKEAVTAVNGRIVRQLVDRGNVEDASAELERHRSEMDPDTASALDAVLRTPLLERRADGIADFLLGTAPPVDVISHNAQASGEVLPRMQAITAHAESGNRERRADGSLVTSSAGAQGKMQVMPGTNLDPGFGVTPAKDNSDAERTRVGRDYLAAMMKRYGNDPAKAWAAYNWGPGALDKALATYGSNWLSHAPAETQAYVRGNITALGGRGTGNQQQPMEHDLNQLLARVDAMHLDFDTEQAVRRQLTQRVGLDEGLLARQREQASERAQEVVNGLGDSYTDISQIPPSVRNQLSPTQIASFKAQGERNLHRDKPTDWKAYTKYSDLLGTDPQAFLAVDPAEMRAKLGDSEFEYFMNARRTMQMGKGAAKPPEQVTHERINSVTDPLLMAAGIVRPPEKGRKAADDQAYWERVGKFRSSVAWEVEFWQKHHPNEQISDNQVSDIANAQLIKMWRQGDNGEKQQAGFAFEVAPGRGVSAEIPPATIENIRNRYKQRWGYFPSETQVWEVYRYGPRGGMK